MHNCFPPVSWIEDPRLVAPLQAGWLARAGHGRQFHVNGLVALFLAALAAPSAAPAAPDSPFQVDRLADGVMLFRPVQQSASRTNSLVIEREDDLLVVEGQPTAEAARELLAVISQHNSRPVRYLVISHPHAEAGGGASAFPEGTMVIASVDCRKALQDPRYDFGAEMRTRAGESWAEPARRMPTLVVRGPTDLDDPINPVQLFTVQQSHSSGDMLLYLPKHDLLYTGGILALDRNPFAGDANVGGWLGVLNNISKQAPKIVVSLHGPAVDVQAIRAQRDAFAWMRGQVEAGFLEDLPLEEIPKRVLQTPGIEQYFDAKAQPSFLALFVKQVLEESVQQRRKRGLM